MALIIPVGYGQAVYSFQLDGDTEPIVTTMGHDLSDVTGGEYQQAADDLYGIFSSSMLPMMSTAYAFTAVDLYVGQDGGPPAIFEGGDGMNSGGEAGPAAPQNCAILMRKRTSLSGRRGRGRCYIPGVMEGSVSPAGVLTGAYQGLLQDAADLWYSALTDPGVDLPAYAPVVLHRSEGAGEEPPPTPIVSFQVDFLIATQRKRLRK